MMHPPPSRCSNSRYDGKRERFQHQQRKDQNQNHVSSLRLPIQKHEREILYLLERHQVVIIIGQTGCGKTTQICQYLRKAKWTIPGEKMVCVTQPRRASAQTVAMRVCEEIFASNSSSSQTFFISKSHFLCTSGFQYLHNLLILSFHLAFGYSGSQPYQPSQLPQLLNHGSHLYSCCSCA